MEIKAIYQAEQREIVPEPKKKVSLTYLFSTFFKIGLVSFGGHMALISVIQRIMVEKDKTLPNEVILNSIGIASLLPGPLAVNVVGQTGYYLRKGLGAVISAVAIILPAFLLMLLLSWAYFSHQQPINWNAAMTYVAGVVSSIILATGLQLYKKEIKGNVKKTILFVVVFLILLFTSNYLVTVALLIAGAITGIFLKIQTDGDGKESKVVGKLSMVASAENAAVSLFSRIVFVLLLLNQVLFFSNATKHIGTGYIKIGLVFTGISLSLFGGGYVMIPIMEALFVKELNWLSTKEFIDAIAFSQATPGPILISATFIGYKVAGLVGALIATAAIFAPSVFMVILVANIMSKYQHNPVIQNMLGGIKTVVVGLIIVAAYKIISQEKYDLWLVGTMLVSFILNFKYKISPVYLIVGAVLLATLKHFW